MWQRPAYQFEQVTGFKGIASRYVMPPGAGCCQQIESFIAHKAKELDIGPYVREGKPYHISMAQYERSDRTKIEMYRPARRELLLSMMQAYAWEFLRYNPELGRVGFDESSIGELYDFCRGVLSGYNPDDIDYYIKQSQQTSRDTKDDAPLMSTVPRLNKFFGNIAVGGRPSPQTLQKITQQLDALELATLK